MLATALLEEVGRARARDEAAGALDALPAAALGPLLAHADPFYREQALRWLGGGR